MSQKDEGGFERIREILSIEGVLEMVTPLRIGTQSAEYSVASVPVLLSYDAKSESYSPMIPGSSLKGVLRHCCERIVNTNGYDRTLVEKMFGGRECGAKIFVRDSVCQDADIEERPHFGTTVEKNRNGYYEVKRENNGRPKGHFIDEEYVVPAEFPVRIDIVNPADEEVCLLLQGLNEFNYFRLHIGGGVSRGYGFAKFCVKKIIKKCIKNLEVKEEKVDPRPLWKIKLNKVSSPETHKKNDFSLYSYADNDELCGCVTVRFEVECISDFVMKGIDEKIQTCGGHAVIPGSTIKGFLRHSCYGNNPRLQWDADKVDDIFGSTRGHASRIFVSDCISNTLQPDDKILKDTKFDCYIVFDNMEKTDIEDVLILLCTKRGVVITGRTSSKTSGNRVRFIPQEAVKYTLTDPKKDILSRVKEVIR